MPTEMPAIRPCDGKRISRRGACAFSMTLGVLTPTIRQRNRVMFPVDLSHRNPRCGSKSQGSERQHSRRRYRPNGGRGARRRRDADERRLAAVADEGNRLDWRLSPRAIGSIGPGVTPTSAPELGDGKIPTSVLAAHGIAGQSFEDVPSPRAKAASLLADCEPVPRCLKTSDRWSGVSKAHGITQALAGHCYDNAAMEASSVKTELTGRFYTCSS